MLSIKARLFLFALRHRNLFQLRLRKESAADWEHNLAEVRRTAAKSAGILGKLPKHITAEPLDLDGLRAEWIAPAGAARDKAVLYFHGGGYVLGSVEAHRSIVAKFVDGLEARALLFGYRLAPEHPFPAALEDAQAAYRHLLAQGYSSQRIVFAGDSAGGGLCLATLLALRDQGLPLPAGAAVLSPWVDLACTGESYTTNAARCLAPTGSWHACRKHYIGGGDPRRPFISPLYGDLQGLPPLSIHVGGHETLLDDSLAFAAKAEAAGVPVHLTVGAGLCHCYPACAPLFPEATQAMAQIRSFLGGRLGG